MGTVRYTTVYGEIIAETRNGVRKQYIPDPQGNTVAMIDNTQTITDTFNYWPYGDIQSRTGTTPTPFQFVGTRGYYKDSASINTKTYVRARHLDVAKCRWLTADPIGFAGGDWNLYRYVGNNPRTMVDPSGLGCWESWFLLTQDVPMQVTDLDEASSSKAQHSPPPFGTVTTT